MRAVANQFQKVTFIRASLLHVLKHISVRMQLHYRGSAGVFHLIRVEAPKAENVVVRKLGPYGHLTGEGLERNWSNHLVCSDKTGGRARQRAQTFVRRCLPL